MTHPHEHVSAISRLNIANDIVETMKSFTKITLRDEHQSVAIFLSYVFRLVPVLKAYSFEAFTLTSQRLPSK